MAEQRRTPHEHGEFELERLLSDLGKHVTFPATPDLRSAVRAGLVEEPRRLSVKSIPSQTTLRRRIVYAAAIALVALAVTLATWSDFRTTVADFFGVRGIRIVVERTTPTPTSTIHVTPTSTPAGTPIGTGLLLGQKLSLTDAQSRVPYRIHVPTDAGLRSPDEVYLRTLPDGNQMVSLIYLPDADFPDIEHTGVGLLLMQFEARNDVNYLGKRLGEDLQWLSSAINGHDAIWIEGAHQLTLLSDPSIPCCDNATRTSGNVLLWEEDGLTFRLESTLNSDEAIAIAESVASSTATPGN